MVSSELIDFFSTVWKKIDEKFHEVKNIEVKGNEITVHLNMGYFISSENDLASFDDVIRTIFNQGSHACIKDIKIFMYSDKKEKKKNK